MTVALPNKKTIGARLRNMRGNRTLDDVSRATGIGRSALNMYEIGHRMPRDDAKITLAAFYGKTVDEIFFAPDE